MNEEPETYQDIVIKMQPIKQYKVKVRIKKIEKAEPKIFID